MKTILSPLTMRSVAPAASAHWFFTLGVSRGGTSHVFFSTRNVFGRFEELSRLGACRTAAPSTIEPASTVGPLRLTSPPMWYSWGPRGLLRALVGPLGGLLEASWGHIGGVLGGFRALLACLTPSEAVLGASRGRFGALLERFRAVLGPSWENLGRSWGPLGPTWGPLGGLMGCLGPTLEASWAILGGRKPKQTRTSQSFNNLRKIGGFGLLGLSWRASWSSLGL